MKKRGCIALAALAMMACDASQPAAPTQALTARAAVLEKLPEGTRGYASLSGDLSLVGSTFVVKGEGNAAGASCVPQGLSNVVLYLSAITLAGGGSDPAGGRTLNFTFSTPMPQGTQFKVIEWAHAYCTGNPIFVIEVVNGS